MYLSLYLNSFFSKKYVFELSPVYANDGNRLSLLFYLEVINPSKTVLPL